MLGLCRQGLAERDQRLATCSGRRRIIEPVADLRNRLERWHQLCTKVGQPIFNRRGRSVEHLAGDHPALLQFAKTVRKHRGGNRRYVDLELLEAPWAAAKMPDDMGSPGAL